VRGFNFRRLLILVSVFVFIVSAGMAIAAAAYHGNIESRIFHAYGCRYYACKNCSAEFETRREALAAGYRPCKVCKP